MRRRSFTSIILVLSLAGCATSAQQLVESAGGGGAVIPDPAVIQSELKGRSLEVGDVYLDLDAAKSHFVLPQDAYVKLMRYELATAFSRAGLARGTTPAYTVSVAIERMKFVKGSRILPNPSILRARMEVTRPDKLMVLRASVESLDSASVPFVAAGVIAQLAVPQSSSESLAHARLIPAMASMLTTIAAGLQEGKTLEAIEVFPDDVRIPQATYVLRQGKFGLRPLTGGETERIGGLRLPSE